MLFAFTVSMLGLAFVIRISHQLVTHKLFTRNEMTKIGTAYICAVMLIAFFSSHTHFALWMSIFVPLAFVVVGALCVMNSRIRTFRIRVVEALSILILKMKSGRSFRQSLAETVAESDPHLRSKLSEITTAVAFSQQTASIDPFVGMMIDEFIQADQNPHAAMRRLLILRDRLRLESDFRRKSGQVLARIRGQSFVMCGLYLAILCFMICKFGWKANSSIMSLSILMFLAGALWIALGGRRLRWKV